MPGAEVAINDASDDGAQSPTVNDVADAVEAVGGSLQTTYDVVSGGRPLLDRKTSVAPLGESTFSRLPHQLGRHGQLAPNQGLAAFRVQKESLVDQRERSASARVRLRLEAGDVRKPPLLDHRSTQDVQIRLESVVADLLIESSERFVGRQNTVVAQYLVTELTVVDLVRPGLNRQQ